MLKDFHGAVYFAWGAASVYVITQAMIFLWRFKGGKWKAMSVIHCRSRSEFQKNGETFPPVRYNQDTKIEPFAFGFPMPRPLAKTWIVLILGALTTLGPLTIDMYLASFPDIAGDLNTTVARVALSLSSYFIGLAVGQLFYGPLLDRFGRKPPLAAGLSLYILASFGCIASHSVEALIGVRFIQALGGSAAGVASVAMVRDLFPGREGVKVFSIMMLILGVSPLLAPTLGAGLTAAFGWHSVFIVLAALAATVLTITLMRLPESHLPDATVTLRIRPILTGFATILREPVFYTYACAGAFSFAALFAYVAGSPVLFMDIYKVDKATYALIFAGLSVGFIGGSQLNLFLSRKYESKTIFRACLTLQTLVTSIFLAGSLAGLWGLPMTLILFFLTMACTGTTYPNAAATALSPFRANAGRAAALLGALQIGTGSLSSAGVGLLQKNTPVPTIAIVTLCTWIGLLILTLGRPHAERSFKLAKAST